MNSVDCFLIWCTFKLLLNYIVKKYYISFTLYPALSRVGRGNQMLRDSVPHIPPIFSRHCVLNGGTQRRDFACQSEEMKILKNKKIKLASRCIPHTAW